MTSNLHDNRSPVLLCSKVNANREFPINRVVFFHLREKGPLFEGGETSQGQLPDVWRVPRSRPSLFASFRH